MGRALRNITCYSRYLLRVTVSRGYGQSTEKDFFFWVRNYAPPPPPSNHPPIKVYHCATALEYTWPLQGDAAENIHWQ